jgi:hypothetical protein
MVGNSMGRGPSLLIMWEVEASHGEEPLGHTSPQLFIHLFAIIFAIVELKNKKNKH